MFKSLLRLILAAAMLAGVSLFAIAAPASATTYSGWSSPVLCYFGSGQWTPVQWQLEFSQYARHIYKVRIGSYIPGYGNDELISTILVQEYSNGVAQGNRYQYPATSGTGWAVYGWTSPAFGTYYMPYIANSQNLRVKIQLIRSSASGGGACEVY